VRNTLFHIDTIQRPAASTVQAIFRFKGSSVRRSVSESEAHKLSLRGILRQDHQPCSGKCNLVADLVDCSDLTIIVARRDGGQWNLKSKRDCSVSLCIHGVGSNRWKFEHFMILLVECYGGSDTWTSDAGR